METKHKNKSKINQCMKSENPNNKINMEEVRDFTKKLTDDKKEILETSFDEIKKLTKELTDLKLQNEEMEIVIGDIMQEKERIEDSYHLLSSTYDALLMQYTETRKLLHSSHDQNVQMSGILEKMRENEQCLVAETQKLRKHGSLQTSVNQQLGVRLDTIGNLEKEVKYWQKEAEKLSQIIEMNDKTLQSSKSQLSLSKKKTSKQMKRYNKVVNRSHSVETSQRRSKELEFEKLKTEKIQMKSLLNDLERQVFEIQNNVIKISDERQKYKEFYFATKDQLDQAENLNVNLERNICDASNENSKATRENQKITEELRLVLENKNKLRLANEELQGELTRMKAGHEHVVKNMESKLSCLVKENHDIGVRSNNLKNSIIALESDFKEMELELEDKRCQTKEYLDRICALEKIISDAKHDLSEKSESINLSNKKYSSLEEKLRKSEEIFKEKMNIKNNEINSYRTKEKEHEEIIQNMKSSFSAHAVKLDNRIQNSEQIIASKIKLITSLELKVANNEKELKSRDEEILNLKKLFNSKEHELEILNKRLSELNEGKKHLEDRIENLSTDHKNANREVITLNEVISELKSSEVTLKSEIKSLKEAFNRKEDQMLVMETQIERQEKEIPLKVDEISRCKRMVSQLENQLDQKESHIGSLLSLLESKEEKLQSILTSNEENERKVKEYGDQLDSNEDCVIQTTARSIALEKEIEQLQNSLLRVNRQKEHLNQMLSARNITIGQLQAQLADKNQRRYLDKVAIVDDFPEFETQEETFCKLEENPIPQSKVPRKCRDHNRSKDRIDNSSHLNQRYQQQQMYAKTLSDNYDDRALRSRAHSYDGRSMNVITAH